jgi:hypothetical protein
MAPTQPAAAAGSAPVAPDTPGRGWPSCFAAAPGTVRRCMGVGRSAVRPRRRHRLREAGLRVVAEELSAQRAGPGTRVARGDDPPQGCKRRWGPIVRVHHQYDRPVPNLSVRGSQEKAALPTGSPLRVRHQRASRSVLRLPRAARPNRRGWSRPAGPGGSQSWLAPPSRRRRAPRFSRCIIEPARPQTPAHAEVSGAHQRPQGREATESVGANFHHQSAHGAAHMSNETAAQAGEIPVGHDREDVNLTPLGARCVCPFTIET